MSKKWEELDHGKPGHRHAAEEPELKKALEQVVEDLNEEPHWVGEQNGTVWAKGVFTINLVGPEDWTVYRGGSYVATRSTLEEAREVADLLAEVVYENAQGNLDSRATYPGEDTERIGDLEMQLADRDNQIKILQDTITDLNARVSNEPTVMDLVQQMIPAMRAEGVERIELGALGYVNYKLKPLEEHDR